MIQVTLAEAQQRLPELLATLGGGESVQIEGPDGQTYRLIRERPRPAVTGRPKAGRWKGQLIVLGDIDEPLEELREYME
jgi:hypothetical protein